MMQIFMSVFFRSFLIVALILVSKLFRTEINIIYLLYILLSLLFYINIILRKELKPRLANSKSVIDIMGIRVILSSLEYGSFLLTQDFLRNPILSIILVQILWHPIKSYVLSYLFYASCSWMNRLLLYPLPIIKEFHWRAKIVLGQHAQRVCANSNFTQRMLVSTSYLFRDNEEYKNKILDYARTSQYGKLKILIAGCATGQEAYSVAITCEENLIEYDILAFDLSESAIERAKRGEYPIAKEISLIRRADKIDSLAEIEHYNRFLSHRNGKFIIKESIKNKISFEVLDLTQFKGTDKYDFIFARKIMYYLPKEKITAVYKNLKNALRESAPESNLIIDKYSKKVLSGLLE